MKEYITKNRARQFVCGHCNEVYSEEPCEPSACDWMAFIDKEPAADVVEVRHGRWTFGKDLPDSFGSISKNKYHLYCSECRHQAFNKSADNDCDFDEDTPFCPWCGSKMVEEKVRENIKDAPTAAVVEVLHGQWIRKEDDSCYWYECSECGEKLAKTQWGNDYFSAYCPNCGTLMDKEER